MLTSGKRSEQKNLSVYSPIKDISTFIGYALNSTNWRAAGYRKEPPIGYIECLYAQAKHESGNFSDYKLTKGFNPFGMGCAVKRPRFWMGKQGIEGQAVYEDLHHAFMDRFNWDVWNNIPYTSAEGYIQEVAAQGYATDPLYAWKWRRVLEDCRYQWCNGDDAKRPFDPDIDLPPGASDVYNAGKDVVETVADGASDVADKVTTGVKNYFYVIGIGALVVAYFLLRK